MKVVVNRCFGGFGLSRAAYIACGFDADAYDASLGRRGNWLGTYYVDNESFGIESDNYKAYRSDPRLIAAIESVGVKAASAKLAKLEIVEIPDGIEFTIDDYDGQETIHEAHRSW